MENTTVLHVAGVTGSAKEQKAELEARVAYLRDAAKNYDDQGVQHDEVFVAVCICVPCPCAFVFLALACLCVCVCVR